MRITISTLVNGHLQAAFERFNRELFLKLNPPFPPVKLLRFDGMAVNDEVHLELNFLLKKEKWISRITDFSAGKDEIYFVDEGVQLPFFFKSWRHKHRLIYRENQTEIVDDIRFECKFTFLNCLVYPVFYLQFLYRKPVYRRHFEQDRELIGGES